MLQKYRLYWISLTLLSSLLTAHSEELRTVHLQLLSWGDTVKARIPQPDADPIDVLATRKKISYVYKVRGLGGNDYFAGFVGWGKFEKV